MAFSAAYDATKDSKNSKELCTYVGSMLCFVVPEFRKPVEAALKEIGVSLRFVSLPSQAHENNNVDSKLPQLNRFYILVIFGYCIFLLFNARKEVCWYNRCSEPTSTDRIYALCTKLGFPPYNDLHIPFNQQNEYAIYTMLATPSLRFSVKTKSPVLSDSRVTTEVYNLSLTSHAVGNFKYFYYFSHLCLDSELFLFDLSRFPTLFAVAMELDRGCSALYKYHDISGRQWHKTEAILSLGMKYEYECGVYL
ncbi:hypothetical protein MtrunA17_Chr2g0293741 [Medicago truncatula]|uniref:Transmembrane protein n=1 Tax=Medicago truncatula TaxID=3880 RepID=A0A396JCW0_MEDTR|nr:hypothetical protein MtrunA17_Chr2g0293741 [Medicago truncatula]